MISFERRPRGSVASLRRHANTAGWESAVVKTSHRKEGNTYATICAVASSTLGPGGFVHAAPAHHAKENWGRPRVDPSGCLLTPLKSSNRRAERPGNV